MEDNLKKLQMEDNLKKIANGRRPQKICKWKTTSTNLQKEDDLIFFCKWKTTTNKYSNYKTTSISFVNGRQLQLFSNMEDDLVNGRQPTFFDK
jgi:hypothetical protein